MEIYKLKEDIINKEQENNKLRLECESYKTAVSQMEKDMKTLVNNRKKIDDLNYVLTNYINNEKNGKNNFNNINDITEYANNFNDNINNQFNPPFTQQQFSYTASSGFGRQKPERDVDANNYNDYSNIKINTPEWLKKLKKKNLK